MMQTFFSWIGDKFLNIWSSFHGVIYFLSEIFLHMLRPKSYNAAMMMVLVKQIYFTTIQLLPLFLIMAVFFGLIIIGAVIASAINFGLEQSIGSIIVTFVVDEFAVLFTALLISLRSGAAVATEIAVMSVNKELDFFRAYKISLIDYLFIPRIISGIISMVSLSIIFAVTMILSGFVFVYFFLNIDFHSYSLLVFNALDVKDFLFLFVKSFVYGFIVMAIPIYSGLQATVAYTQIPIAVLNGMVKLFIAIFLVEVISLIIQFS